MGGEETETSPVAYDVANFVPVGNILCLIVISISVVHIFSPMTCPFNELFVSFVCFPSFSSTWPASSHSDQDYHHLNNPLLDPRRQRRQLYKRSDCFSFFPVFMFLYFFSVSLLSNSRRALHSQSCVLVQATFCSTLRITASSGGTSPSVPVSAPIGWRILSVAPGTSSHSQPRMQWGQDASVRSLKQRLMGKVYTVFFFVVH